VTAKTWIGVVPARLYAKFGPGFYTVRGTSWGPGVRCSGAALIKVV
jgi:hypothetical protein